jgi:hypothetical protein
MFRHAEALGRLGDKCREGIIGYFARSMYGRQRSLGRRRMLNSIDDAKIATMHNSPARDRNAAIVLAAVKGEALTLQPDGCPVHEEDSAFGDDMAACQWAAGARRARLHAPGTDLVMKILR